MKSNTTRAKRWISLGLLMLMVLSFAVPTFAAPTIWATSISVTKQPNKTTYEIGESFDPTGMKVVAKMRYRVGKAIKTQDLELNNSQLTFSPAKFTKAGSQKVSIRAHLTASDGSEKLFSTTVTVKVNEAGDGPTEYYTDIFVAAQPKKTVYEVGESFSTSGLSISAHKYSEVDGKKHTETKMSQKDMKISPTKFTKSGKQDVKLSLKLLSKSGEYKWFSTTVQVTVEKGPVKITKHPYGETVQEGGSCGFVSRADNANSRHWYFYKGGVVVDADDASSYFPGLKVTGTEKEHIKLSNIPASLNGWSVYCVFNGKDGSVKSNKAGIVVLANESTAEPNSDPEVVTTPKVITTTPQPTDEPEVTDEPEITDEPSVTETPGAPATPKATKTPAPTPEPDYAEGIYCTINGETLVPIEGDTLLECEADEIEGFVFDHWEINGEPDYESGASAAFIASEACVIRAYYHERKVLRTVNCFFQLLTKNNNASGTKYTEFDFEDAYYSPVTKNYLPAGTLSCYVTAVIPKKAQVDYWLINGVKYQFPESNVQKFRILDLNEATTIEVVFKNTSPTNEHARPAIAEELVYQEPHVMRCINCWGQFMNASGTPSGKNYQEFNFDKTYTNPVTKKKLAGGHLDIFISTKLPKHCGVESWIINDVKYQFPVTVLKFRVTGLDEATTYEVRFRTVRSATPTPNNVYYPAPTYIVIN